MKALSLLLVLAMVATGCQPRTRESSGGTLHILIGTPSGEALTDESLESNLGEFKPLIDGFRELHPGVRLTFAVFQESHLEEELRRRNAAGLAPDLLMISAIKAVELEHDHLIRRVKIPADELRHLEMKGLTRLELNGQTYAGVPVVQEPQVACFNRKRLSTAPATVEELERLAANGNAFGMTVDPIQLYWSAGSLGAREAVLAALEKQSLTDTEKATITAWLRWLQNLNLKQVVTFLPDKDHLVARLASQDLDWIPCRCGNIPLLRHHLGDNLGVAPLPAGPGGQASPVTRQIVWGFGLNSSDEQQKLADQLVRFSINPLSQRTIALSNNELLPANRLALPPTGNSAIRDSLLLSQKQGLLGHHFIKIAVSDKTLMAKLRELLVAVIYGELTPEQATAQLIRFGRSLP